jgi:hypothetical protein
MTRIMVDDLLRGKLHNFKQALEFCDESGAVLARLVPVLGPAEYEGAEPRVSKEELERRKQEKGGKTYSTAEVLAYLEKL